MKKLLFVFALMLVSTSAFSQTVDNIFNEFKDKPGAQVINLSKSLLSMFTSSNMDEKNKKLLENIDSMQILHIEDNKKTCKEFIKKAEKMNTDGYETMANVKEEDETTRILTRSNGDTINDVIILHIENDECTLLQISGKISPDDIDNIVKLQDIGE